MRGDLAILALIECGRLRVDAKSGHIYAPLSNTPDKPAGSLTKKGYLRICLNVLGRQMHFMAHRIVWVSVHGPLAPGLQIDHGPAGKSVNRIDNLDAVSGRENMRRAKVAGAFRHVGRRDGIRDTNGRFGKKAAGRLLDGREWNEVPK